MTTENGALDGVADNSENVNKETQDQSSGNNDINAKLEEMKKDAAGKDAKITELLKAQERLNQIESLRESEELEKKSTEEKVQIFQSELNEYKRRDALNEALSGSGISSSQVNSILKETDVTAQANALKELVQAMASEQSKTAVESFKSETLGSVAKDVPPTNNDGGMDELDKQARIYAGLHN